jgi:glucuronosyltransferase
MSTTSRTVFTLITLLSVCVLPGFTARILMIPIQYESLILMEVSVAEELIQLGHEVYIVLGSPYPKLEAIQRRGVRTLTYRIPSHVLYGVSPEMERMLANVTFSHPDDVMQIYANVIIPSFHLNCDYMMTDREFIDKVRELHFDLAVAQNSPLTACCLILPHFLHVPFVTMAIQLFPGPWSFGLPALPSFYELPVFKPGTNELPDVSTFSGRLFNTFAYFFKHFTLAPQMWGNTSLLERYASPDVTSWMDLLHRSEIFLSENDHHLESAPLPLMPNFIPVAGLTIRPVKSLPESLEKIILESGDNGIIVVVFGSTTCHMPADIIKKFLDGFSRLQQTIIVRLTVPHGMIVPENVKVMSWLPQNDILAHNKTKVLVTHCGSKSQYEALYHGVPMLGFPLFADQAWNCERVRRKGFGLKMDILNFTADELYENISELLKNSVYRQAISKMSKIFRDQPMSGSQKAAYWIEHVIKYGGDHLRSPSSNMPLYQFLMLDILTFIVAMLFTFLFLVTCFVKMLWVTFTQNRKAKIE